MAASGNGGMNTQQFAMAASGNGGMNTQQFAMAASGNGGMNAQQFAMAASGNGGMNAQQFAMAASGNGGMNAEFLHRPGISYADSPDVSLPTSHVPTKSSETNGNALNAFGLNSHFSYQSNHANFPPNPPGFTVGSMQTSTFNPSYAMNSQNSSFIPSSSSIFSHDSMPSMMQTPWNSAVEQSIYSNLHNNNNNSNSNLIGNNNANTIFNDKLQSSNVIGSIPYISNQSQQHLPRKNIYNIQSSQLINNIQQNRLNLSGTHVKSINYEPM
jgi:hypothetical protein